MIANVIQSRELFEKNAWSIQSFLPQEQIRTGGQYRLIKLKELVHERKERVTLSSEDSDINYVGLENIEAGTGRIISFAPKQGVDIKSACKRFYRGDVLYGRLRPNLNKVYFNDLIESGVCSTEILVLVPLTSKVNPVYFAALLRTEPINKRIVSLIKGSALPRVSMSDLMQLALPIPPLEEQDRIAIVIQEKRAELENHIRIVKQIPLEINEYITSSFRN